MAMRAARTGEDPKIRRFSPARILEHWVGMLTFTTLVVTGLSQKFSEWTICQAVVLNLGGIDTVRLIHRYAGIVFALALLLHMAAGIEGFLMRRWPASMMINRKDFLDAVQNLRYYFGLSDHTAYCDRYDYKQKFEYWGVILGGILMAVTGFALWFPTTVTRFLAGELIPVAKALHSNEALMAFLVIAIWHIYNAMFSPEVFPLDTSIFTGTITRKRMVHEHPVELARMENRKLEDILRQAPGTTPGDGDGRSEASG